MYTHLRIVGSLLIMLALLHFYFPRYFDWKRDFAPVSMINRQMFYVHSFFIAFVVFLMGVLCLTSSEELIGTVLGKRICLGIGLFWTARLFVQFFVYSSKLWRGKRRETIVHVLFSVFWIYFSSVFIFIYVG
jgi:Mn2+/Fe2+ NRAMP family transporter